MVGNILIDISTVNIDNNVNFTLNWDEPFDNFDPIVNYTITINCNDASCPVMFTVTATSASVSFITDLSMMTPLSVTATNTVGTSDPTTIITAGKLCICIHTYIHTYGTYICMLILCCLQCMYTYVQYIRTYIYDKFYKRTLFASIFVKYTACIIIITCYHQCID